MPSSKWMTGVSLGLVLVSALATWVMLESRITSVAIWLCAAMLYGVALAAAYMWVWTWSAEKYAVTLPAFVQRFSKILVFLWVALVFVLIAIYIGI